MKRALYLAASSLLMLCFNPATAAAACTLDALAGLYESSFGQIQCTSAGEQLQCCYGNLASCDKRLALVLAPGGQQLQGQWQYANGQRGVAGFGVSADCRITDGAWGNATTLTSAWGVGRKLASAAPTIDAGGNSAETGPAAAAASPGQTSGPAVAGTPRESRGAAAAASAPSDDREKPALLDDALHIDLARSEQFKTAFERYCRNVDRAQQFQCSQCIAIHDKLRTLSSQLGRGLNANILQSSARSYGQFTTGCAQLFNPEAMPEGLREHIALLRWMSAGGMPKAALENLPGNEGPAIARRARGSGFNRWTAVEIEEVTEALLFSGGLKSVANLGHWLRQLNGQAISLDRFCPGITGHTTTLLDLVDSEELARNAGMAEEVVAAARALSAQLDRCDATYEEDVQADDTRIMARRQSYRRAQVMLSTAARHFADYPTFYVDRLFALAPAREVAQAYSLPRLAEEAGSVAAMCEADQRQACATTCRALGEDAARVAARVDAPADSGYAQLRAELDALDLQIARCADETAKEDHYWDARTVFAKLQERMDEDQWPLKFRDYADTHRPTIAIEEFVFTQPAPPPHRVFASEFTPDGDPPVFRVVKTAFSYGDILEAYRYAADAGCKTVGGGAVSACQQACELGRSHLRTIASAFARRADRFAAADELRSRGCAEAMEHSNLKGKNEQVDRLIAFQQALEHELFPPDRQPQVNELRYYCAFGQSGPFSGNPACEYLSAIYYGDYQKATYLDHMAGEPLAKAQDFMGANMDEWLPAWMQGTGMETAMRGTTELGALAARNTFSLNESILQTYLSSYDRNYAECLGPDPIKVTITRERVRQYKNAYGMVLRTEEIDPAVYTFRFKRKFSAAASEVGTDGATPVAFAAVDWLLRADQRRQPGVVSVADAVKGTLGVFAKLDCDDPIVERLEDNMIEYATEFFPEYARLAVQGR